MEHRYKTNPTWREQRITIEAKSTHEVVFSSTMPNYFFINNQAGGDLYMSVSDIPDVDHFDMFVEAGGRNIYARGIGAQRVMIYNDSASASNFTLTTFEEEFSPSALGSSASINIVGGIVYDGVIRGFNVPLPIGTNNIGKVDIASIPSLPAGINNIGDVDVITLPSIPAGNNNIGDVDIVSSPDISTAIPTIYNVTLTNANQEYSQAFTNAKKICISIQDGLVTNNFRIAFVTGKVATPSSPFLKYPQTVEYSIDKCNIANGTIYLASSLAGAVAQIQIS